MNPEKNKNSEIQESNNIALRPFTIDDVPTVVRWMEHASQEELMLWAGPNFTAPFTERQLKKFLKLKILPHKSWFYVIEAQNNGKAVPAGVVMLRKMPPSGETGRIGLVLIGDPAWRGRGIASRALIRLMDIGFHDLGLHKITLQVFTSNVPAVSCYKGIGFHTDGVLRNHFTVNGKHVNVAEMSILADEWLVLKERLTGNRTGLKASIYLETERMIIRTFSARDADLALRFYRDNREFFQRWSPARDDEFYTLKGQRQHLLEGMEMEQAGTGLRLWMLPKERLPDTRLVHDKPMPSVIGNMSLTSIVRGFFQSAYIGYQLDERWKGQGLATEGVRELLRIGFDKLKLHRIEANIMPANTRSQALVTRLGFHPEGLSRKYLLVNGQWEDHIHYVILADDPH